MQPDLWTSWSVDKTRHLADFSKISPTSIDRTAVIMVPARYGMSFGAMRFLDHSTSQQEHEPS